MIHFYMDKQIKAHTETLHIFLEEKSSKRINCGCPDVPVSPVCTKKNSKWIPQDYKNLIVVCCGLSQVLREE